MPPVGIAVTTIETPIVGIRVGLGLIRSDGVQIRVISNAVGPRIVSTDGHAAAGLTLQRKQHRMVVRRCARIDFADKAQESTLSGLFQNESPPLVRVCG